MVIQVNSHTNATRIGWHMWEVDLNFAPGLPPRSGDRPPPSTSSARLALHLGDNPGTNFKSISHRFHLREFAFEWELTKETIVLPLGCIQGLPLPPRDWLYHSYLTQSAFKVVLQKSTPTRIRQLILHISHSKA